MAAMNIPWYVRDDYYGCAAEGLCLAAMDYSPDRGKFSSIAIRYIRNKIADERDRVLNTHKRSFVELPMEEKNTVYQVDKMFQKVFENNSIMGCHFEDEIRMLSNRDRKIILLKYKGYTVQEIADMENVSRALVRKRMKYIKRKLEELNEV